MIPIIMNLTFTDPGDDRRFKALVNRYWDTLVNVAEDILGNAMDAEDAAQNAFIKLYRKFEKYKDLDDESMVYLLYTITRNCAKDIYRKNSLNSKRILSFEEDRLSLNVKHDENGSKLLDAMLKLDKSDRRIVALKYWYDLDIKSIAEEFDISVKTAYKRLERAKEKLAAALEESNNE